MTLGLRQSTRFLLFLVRLGPDMLRVAVVHLNEGEAEEEKRSTELVLRPLATC